MRISKRLVVSSRDVHSTYRVADLHVLDLLRNVLLQACIWFEPSHFSVRLSFLERGKRVSAHAILGLDEGHRMARACRCFVRHTGALEHELEDVEHVQGRGFVRTREKIQHDGGDSQVKVEQGPRLDPVNAPAAIGVAFAILPGVCQCTTFTSEATEDHGVA